MILAADAALHRAKQSGETRSGLRALTRGRDVRRRGVREMTRYIKQSFLVISLLSIAALSSAERKPAPVAAEKKSITLTVHEEEIAHRIGFDDEVLLLLKEETQDCCIHRMIGYDADGYQIMADGITATVPQDKVERVLAALKPKLLKKGYMAFIVEMNEGIKTDKIGVLKGTDPYALLRVMQTNGNGDDVSNEDVISTLQEWEKCCPFEILGAENDWVEIEFKKLPPNLKTFVENLEDFCPAVVDDGGASAEDELAKELQRSKRLYLWWE